MQSPLLIIWNTHSLFLSCLCDLCGCGLVGTLAIICFTGQYSHPCSCVSCLQCQGLSVLLYVTSTAVPKFGLVIVDTQELPKCLLYLLLPDKVCSSSFRNLASIGCWLNWSLSHRHFKTAIIFCFYLKKYFSYSSFSNYNRKCYQALPWPSLSEPSYLVYPH